MGDSVCFASYLTFKHEVLLLYRHYAEVLNPLLFFVMVLSLFPLAISPDPHVLQNIAPGAIWIVALLSILLTLDRLFRDDLLDGSLEQLLLSPHSLSILLFAKIFAHWLMSSMPLIVIAPVLGLVLNLPFAALKVLIVSLLLGTPVLVFIGAIGRALTAHLRNSGLLIALLVLPFYIPVLIFGASSVEMASHGLNIAGQLAWLGVLLILTLPLAPLASAAALRVGI